MPAPSSPDAQIQTWIQAVARETLPPPTSSSNTTHAMRLRPRTAKPLTRSPLQKSAGNQRRQQRHLKRENPQSATGRSEDKQRAMDNDKPSSPKKRGRPPKDKTAQASTPFDLSKNLQLQLRPGSQAPSSTNLPARTSSPTRSKRTLPDPGYIKAESALSMTDLKTCQPPVFQMDLASARKSGPVPPSVEALYKTLKSVKHACIPPELKAAYHTDTDTPKKSRDAPADAEYLPTSAKQFPTGRCARMKESINVIQQDAGWNHRTKAHERNWGKGVSNVLFDYQVFEPTILGVNVIRPESATGEPIKIDDNSTVTTGSGQSTQIGRMIDWVLTLRLDFEELELISIAFSTVEACWRSLNQSLADFVRECPIIIDFELKKELSLRDPEVQLAVWACAGLRKKQQMQWSTELPMPGIVVDGHTWTCYLFFEQKGRLIMCGPIPIGNTSTLEGTWQIYYQLMLLVEWGTTVYRKWFEKEVLGWARTRIGTSASGSEDVE
ncbi:MAG: hypothetical protein Q9207_003055 [Kuettlingeria erythrocarpa]